MKESNHLAHNALDFEFEILSISLRPHRKTARLTFVEVLTMNFVISSPRDLVLPERESIDYPILERAFLSSISSDQSEDPS